MSPYTPLPPSRISDSAEESHARGEPLELPKSRRIKIPLDKYPQNTKKERKKQSKRNRSPITTRTTLHTQNAHMSNHGTGKSFYRVIYCAATDVTYEGHILCNDSSLFLSKNHSNGKGDSESDLSITPVHYVKHGKGILRDHSNHMTIEGYFQNNAIIGHALQTLYLNTSASLSPLSASSPNDLGSHVLMAQYEGTFELQETCPIDSTSTSKSISKSRSQQWLRHGTGKYTFHNTNDTYSGQFQHNVFHGHGTFVWGATGDRYEGGFKRGVMHGQGMKYTQGDVFTGKFKRGKAHGWGNMVFSNGDIFDGMYSRDLRQGFGKYSFFNGDSYIGNWDSGRTSGRGVKSFTFSMGRSRSESFLYRLQHDEQNILNNEVIGDEENTNNMFPLCHGDVEQVHYGEWNRETGSATGIGVRTYACGDEYFGLYSLGLRNGYGVYTWKNGDVYEGQFSNGLPCGLGIKRMRNGDVMDGEWDQGKAHGYGVKTFSTGGAHMGYYEDDERCGCGIMVWPNGDEYHGGFQGGDLCGFGSFLYANENLNVYRGQWFKKKKHGPGYFKVNTRNRCIIYFELWFRGKRICKQKLALDWDQHVPSNEQLQEKFECLQELKKENWICQI